MLFWNPLIFWAFAKNFPIRQEFNLWLAKSEFTVLPECLPEMTNLSAIYTFKNPQEPYKLEEIRLKMTNCSFYDCK